MIDKEQNDELERQEIWIRCFFDGYFCKFVDMEICVVIEEENPDFPEKSHFKGTRMIFPPIDEKDGQVDLTPLLFTLLQKMKEKPEGKFKCYATGFGRQMHLNKDLLTAPMPEGFLKMFNVDCDG
jgi:hypothetical protein